MSDLLFRYFQILLDTFQSLILDKKNLFIQLVVDMTIKNLIGPTQFSTVRPLKSFQVGQKKYKTKPNITNILSIENKEQRKVHGTSRKIVVLLQRRKPPLRNISENIKFQYSALSSFYYCRSRVNSLFMLNYKI